MSGSTGPTSAVWVDVIEIERVEAALARFGERFLRRVYTAEEAAFCRGRVHELAARVGAQEAGGEGGGAWGGDGGAPPPPRQAAGVPVRAGAGAGGADRAGGAGREHEPLAGVRGGVRRGAIAGP